MNSCSMTNSAIFGGKAISCQLNTIAPSFFTYPHRCVSVTETLVGVSPIWLEYLARALRCTGKVVGGPGGIHPFKTAVFLFLGFVLY